MNDMERLTKRTPGGISVGKKHDIPRRKTAMDEDKMQISIGLPKEAWEAAAERVKIVAFGIADYLKKLNHEGQGEKDAEEWLRDAHLAYMAMMHVANFANDKCRFITFSEPPKEEN